MRCMRCQKVTPARCIGLLSWPRLHTYSSKVDGPHQMWPFASQAAFVLGRCEPSSWHLWFAGLKQTLQVPHSLGTGEGGDGGGTGEGGDGGDGGDGGGTGEGGPEL